MHADAFPLVATLFWLHALQPGGNLQVSGGQAMPSLHSAHLTSTVTTRQTPSDQPVSNLLASHPQNRRAPITGETKNR
jgi:hypothetical protein